MVLLVTFVDVYLETVFCSQEWSMILDAVGKFAFRY